jgi:rod shape determining protein RodA
MPGSAPEKNFALQQLLWFGGAAVVFIFILWVGYERLIDYSYILFAVNIILLAMVLTVGSIRFGAKRWISFGLFSLQPSEFCKISFILAIAKYISDNNERINSLTLLSASLLMCIIPSLLIIKQPDLGTALVFMPVLCAVLFVAGIRKRHLLYLFLTGLAGSPFLWNILKEYQKKRLLVFLNPNADPLGAGYTIIQSKIAVGAGGLFGKGWLSGTQNQLNFLPERHTDFIFSVIGEEWGFVGSAVVIILFLLLLRGLFSIADSTNDLKGKLLVSGIATMLWFHIFVNISMTIGLMPVVGIPLPFISYGGSNLMTTVALMALAASVKFHRKIF